MDYYCIRLTVALAVSSHIVSGRSYASLDRQGDFHGHQGYHYPQPKPWHDGQHGWHQHRPSASNHRYEYYQRDHKDFNPHKNTNDHKKNWGGHSSEWDSGSWEYPDFPGHGESNSWGYPGWGNNNRPNRWNHPEPSWSNDKPTWNNGNSDWGTATTPPPSTSPRITANSGSQDTLATLLCIRSCPVTSEYNPVCGSNNVTYGNPGRLECAQYCGVDVTVQRNSVCPAPGITNTPTQNQPTVRPSQNPPLQPVSPTRFTTVEVPPTEATSPPAPADPSPPVTISQDILNSIFSPPTTPEDDNYEIDIRTRSRQPELEVVPEPFIYPV